MLPTCVFCLQCRSLPLDCRVCRWWMEASCSGYTTSDSWRNRGVQLERRRSLSGICRVGWRLFAVCAQVCTVPARSARRRCWAAMSLSAERARVRMTTHQGAAHYLAPGRALGGCHAAAFTQCVNFLLKGLLVLLMRSRWRSSTCCDKSTSFVFSVCAPWRNKLRTAPVASPEAARHGLLGRFVDFQQAFPDGLRSTAGRCCTRWPSAPHSPRVLA